MGKKYSTKCFILFLGVIALTFELMVLLISGQCFDFDSPNIRESQDDIFRPTLTRNKGHLTRPSPIDLVVVSNRGFNEAVPLRAFVNSLLSYTSEKINLNVVTETALPWLDDLNGTEYFSVFYHEPHVLAKRTKRLLNETQYSSKHYSAFVSSMKLFLPTLQFSGGTAASKVLLVDDDVVFYNDVAPLMRGILKHPDKLSLACPVDARRVETYWTKRNRTRNGHSKRFCQGGWMGLPVGEHTSRKLAESLDRIVKEYPELDNFRWSAADQDAINRYLADYLPAECDGTRDDSLKQCIDAPVHLIPCEWSCDWHSCGKGVGSRGDGNLAMPCENCPQKCKAFHFLKRSYTKKRIIKKWEPVTERWGYYDHMSSLTLLAEFVDRINSR